MSATNIQENTNSAENNNLTNSTENHTTSADKNKNFIKMDSFYRMEEFKINTPLGEFILNGKSELSFEIECSEQVLKLIENMVTGTR